MALKTVTPFPIFAPIPTTTTTTTSTTEVRFARWNNANAEKFERVRRTQQQIEDDIRRYRRFESALNISNFDDSNNSESSNPTFKSIGTPSIPSVPSIPGKKSKYSKTQQNPKPNSGNSSHPAFRKVAKRAKLPRESENRVIGGETDIRVGDNGVTYVVPGAPFEFMYSYTETPKNVKPIGLREPAVTPFGPGTMPRPWTGRKPLPGSKKELPQFDSFRVPEPGKKGVKPVQNPGPFLPGSGPKYVMSKEEVLGEPLTAEEVKDLVEGCRKTKRQLNMGRDGLTHNMLDNIHAHWKRRRVCKIKCKGVCTVDMDTVCQQLEEKTGGKIIYRRGGSLFLFRGRNYNYRTRPRFPLMLWKPVTPVYPRLIARVPDGLTLEEATDMQRRGRDLTPICKLGKNGVYVNLAKDVREAFEACKLVRINCQGLNSSDCRKIGAKLKDLVPCVLISFEYEHILMWRGKDWKSSFLTDDGAKNERNAENDSSESHGSYAGNLSDSEDEEEFPSSSKSSNERTSTEMPNLELGIREAGDKSFERDGASSSKDNAVVQTETSDFGNRTMSNPDNPLDDKFSHDGEQVSVLMQSGSDAGDTKNLEVLAGNLEDVSETSPANCHSVLASPCTEGVLDLLKQAVESGRAVILDDSFLDADMVYERSVAVAQVAPPGPVFNFQHRPSKVSNQKRENKNTLQESENKNFVQENESKNPGDLEAEEAVPVAEPVMAVNKANEKKSNGRKGSRIHKGNNVKQDLQLSDLVPQGSLEIDELAKLLA